MENSIFQLFHRQHKDLNAKLTWHHRLQDRIRKLDWRQVAPIYDLHREQLRCNVHRSCFLVQIP